MSELRTDFKDDILAEAMGGRRRYQMIQNEDGTVSFVDVTEYEQVGSEFGQAEINQTNTEVNSKVDSADVVDPMTATELGFVADAKLTGDALSGLNAKMIVGWGAHEKISLPYTATSDGLLVLYFQSASSSGGNYYVIREGDSNIALAANSNGSAITVSTFAREGDNFTFLSSDNYGFASLEFIPFAKAG